MTCSCYVVNTRSVSTHRRTFAVAFRIYDLDDTGSINQGEVQRLLAALLADNPALDLDEGAIQKIVQQVRSSSGGEHHVGEGRAPACLTTWSCVLLKLLLNSQPRPV